MARIVFMGTPEFAVPALQALIEHHRVVGVVTQPDRRAGRGRKLKPSPVKKVALAQKTPLFQPKTLRTPEAAEHLAEWRPDVIVVAAFGQILRKPALELPPHGCINVHASLLPRYRGAAPIPAAILAGDTVSGVTIMRMDEGMDTGPILAQAERPIAPDDTTASLTAKLADLGAELLIETLPGWLSGDLQAQPQNDSQATYCSMLKKKDGFLDWRRSAAHLDRQVRACDPWPSTYTTWQGQRLKVLRARPHPDWQGEGQPGVVILESSELGVVTGQGCLELLEVQLAGKRAMAADTFARGQRGLVGGRLGS
ncbi:MAG: methionyl-tRNA formyltransferase [Anaerolineae bacterium]|jgi:methionyl-tRNA formyltransferase